MLEIRETELMNLNSIQSVIMRVERDGLPYAVMLVALLVSSGCNWREDKSTYYPNGQVKVRWQERMVGPYRTVKDGKFELFYPTGAKMASGEFRNGDTLGLWEEWYLYGGKKAERTYGEQGKPRGRAVVWMPNGDTLEIRGYNDLGQFHGRFVAFWPDIGEVHHQGDYLNGKRHGGWQAWYRNGKPEYEREYDRGRFVGTWIECGPDGNVASRREYLRDLPAELSSVWEKALVEGVPVGVSLDYQRIGRRVDTIPSEERIYGDLQKRRGDWIVPFKWSSPRFATLYKARFDTLVVWRDSASERAK